MGALSYREHCISTICLFPKLFDKSAGFVFICAPIRLLSLSRQKWDTHLHIYFKYQGSCYFCQVILSSHDWQELPLSFVHTRKLWIHSAQYNVLTYKVYSHIFLCEVYYFVIFYFQTKSDSPFLINSILMTEITF